MLKINWEIFKITFDSNESFSLIDYKIFSELFVIKIGIVFEFENYRNSFRFFDDIYGTDIIQNFQVFIGNNAADEWTILKLIFIFGAFFRKFISFVNYFDNFEIMIFENLLTIWFCFRKSFFSHMNELVE